MPPDETGSGIEKGQGGEGGAGPTEACPGCSSGLCLADGTCVDCLPGAKDTCPTGQFCGEENECVRGCKNGSSCASGVCKDHNCMKCISDDECTDQYVCSNGECAPSCTTAQEGTSNGCSDGLTCCDLRCADLATDSQNCGACGTLKTGSSAVSPLAPGRCQLRRVHRHDAAKLPVSKSCDLERARTTPRNRVPGRQARRSPSSAPPSGS